MSSHYGQALRFSFQGESHGVQIGGQLEGLPSGTPIDEQAIACELARRRPGKAGMSPRKERDEVVFWAGVRRDETSGTLYTCGGPVAFTLKNEDAHPGDYDLARPRPGHADLAAWYRDGGFLSGGGRFSGRLTAPLVVVGGLLRPMLSAKGVHVGGLIQRVGSVCGGGFETEQRDPAPGLLAKLRALPWPAMALKTPSDALTDGGIDDAAAMEATPDTGLGDRMQAEAMRAAGMGDSVGSQIELAVVGLPPGCGEPPYLGVEPHLGQILFSIPGVKAVSFGWGEAFATHCGSETNDAIGLKDGLPYPITNHAGGINGGLTNGRAVIVKVSLRPTPSIAKSQQTVDLSQMKAVDLHLKGRHDPCLAPRALPALESAALLAVADLLVLRCGPSWLVTK